MSSATCVEAIKSGENSMKKSYRSIEPKGIEDYLRELCVIYRGEMDNPHDVNAIIDEERKIQILRYHLWDVEKSVLENPGEWRYLIIEEYGSIPIEESAMARRIYDYAVKAKLDRLAEMGINLTEVYRRISR